MTIRIRTLRWNAWNTTHIAQHAVTPEAVESVCRGPVIARATYQGRLLLIGPDATGRMLAVVLALEEDDQWYPITARPASRQERRLYDQESPKGGPTL
jgi:uncharacterized DUF497 family protein